MKSESAEEFREWAIGAAGDPIAHVERHGIACSWSEAVERLELEAGQGARHVMIPGDDTFDGEIFITEDGEHLTPLCNPPGWRHPEFVEYAACTHVHWHRQPYHPADPATATMGVAVPFTVLAEVVNRFTLLLQVGLNDLEEQPSLDHGALPALKEVASLATVLSAHLHSQVEWITEDGGALDGNETIAGANVVLVPSCDLYATARILEAAASSLARADPTELDRLTLRNERKMLTDSDDIECCVRSLDWWLGVA